MQSGRRGRIIPGGRAMWAYRRAFKGAARKELSVTRRLIRTRAVLWLVIGAAACLGATTAVALGKDHGAGASNDGSSAAKHEPGGKHEADPAAQSGEPNGNSQDHQPPGHDPSKPHGGGNDHGHGADTPPADNHGSESH